MRSVKDIFRSYAVLENGIHVNGTDKESNHHYGDAYEKLFAMPGLCDPVYVNEVMVTRSCRFCSSDTSHMSDCLTQRTSRQEAKLMLEIGVADGSSLLAWSEVFPNATVVGMDIHPAAKWSGEFHLGDQRLQADCLRVAAGRLFDVIVEDAVHSVENSLLTFFWLWPFVAPGGFYIVEEFAGVPRRNLLALGVEIVDTIGPSGGCEPLIVWRKNA